MSLERAIWASGSKGATWKFKEMQIRPERKPGMRVVV